MDITDFEKIGINQSNDPFNYMILQDRIKSIDILQAIENTGAKVKLSDIITNSIQLVGNYHVVDITIGPLNVIITLNHKVFQTVVVPSLGSHVVWHIDMDCIIKEDDTHIDIVALREATDHLRTIRLDILTKITKLACVLRDKYCTVSYPPYIQTNLTSEDIAKVHAMEISSKPCSFVYFNKDVTYSYLEGKGAIALFDDSFIITHIGFIIDGEYKVVNLEEDSYLLEEIDEMVSCNIYELFVRQMEFFTTIL